jgi:hypothetical protein
MGYTTKLSDYEMERAWTHVPPPEGVDIEAERESAEKPKKTSGKSETKKDAGTTRSKVVEPEKKTPAKKSTARTKSK